MLGAVGVVMMSGGLALMTSAPAQASVDNTDNVTICHDPQGNGNTGNGYTIETVDPFSIIKDSGHDSHDGDIIPVFTYNFDQGSKHFEGTYPGKNTDRASWIGNDCAAPTPEKTSVSPVYPWATEATCETGGHLVVPSQPAGVVVSGDGQDGDGPGTYTFTYAPDSTHVFPQGTDTSRTVTVPDRKTGDQCGQQGQPDEVSPLYPSANPPTCSAAGTLVVPAQPAGVTVSGGGADGDGPGTYTFSYAPDSRHVFPQGTDTSRTVTVLPQKSGGACSSDVQPTLVTPNAPTQTEPTCTTAGSIAAPAAQTGVVVTSTDLGNGATRFDSVPASGYTFGQGAAQSVSHTVTAKPRLTGAGCGEVEGTDGSTDEPPAPAPGQPEVEGTTASRTPPVVKVPAVKAPAVKAPAVRGVSAAVPNAVDAGLAGAPLTDVRVLVGRALLGGGLLLLAGAGWSGLGLRRRGALQA